MNDGKKRLTTYQDLQVYQMAFQVAMEIFEATKNYPREERYSLVDQVRLSSRSVCANISEAFRKRLYPAAFVSKLSDANAEAGETEVWLEFSWKCGYMTREQANALLTACEQITGKLIRMIRHPEHWKV